MNQEQALRGGFSWATFPRGGEGWDILQSPFSPGHPDRDQYRFELRTCCRSRSARTEQPGCFIKLPLLYTCSRSSRANGVFPSRKVSMSRYPDCPEFALIWSRLCSPGKVRTIAKPAGALECGRYRRISETLPVVKRNADQCLAVSGGCHVAVSMGSPM